MPKTAEQILKSQGLNDADIAAMSTLLADARYRAAIEAPVNALETEVETWKARDAEWQTNLDTQYLPAVTKAEKDAQQARLEAAEAREQLKIAKEYGYLPEGDAQAKADAAAKAVREAATQNTGKFNVNDPEFTQFAGNFATRQGRAMVTLTDIASQHQRLFGQPLENMEALYDKFLSYPPNQREQNSLRAIWEREYKVPEKRAEIQRKAQEAHDAEVARQAVEKYALEHGTNPMTQRANPSRMPLMPAKVNDGKIVQPWDRPTATSERRQRAYENETKARVM